MATGDLTCTYLGRSSISGTTIAALITGQNLAAATDVIMPVVLANGQEVMVFKIARSA